MSGGAGLIRGDALHLPLADESVDLVITSPPFWALRSYSDAGEHYPGQLGSEPHWRDFLWALWAATAEMARVLKPGGSIFVNLGDSYSDGKTGPTDDYLGVQGRGVHRPGTTSQWTNANAAWLAAVLDCEGSVSGRIFKNSGGGDSFVTWMRVGMMDREVVDRIQEITGVGKVFRDSRNVWHWDVASQMSRYVLERIWPWLRTKQKRALAAIELCRHVEERAARGKRTLTHNDLAYRAAIIQAIRDWNAHPARPNDYEPPRPAPIELPDSLEDIPAKSLRLLPERYRIGCVERLGLIARSVTIQSKMNSLPESVTDRVRRSHEDWVHLTREPRYYSAVDEIREPSQIVFTASQNGTDRHARAMAAGEGHHRYDTRTNNPLGKLPGSVWSLPSEPLRTPEYMILASPTDMDPRWCMTDKDAWWLLKHGITPSSSAWPRDDTRGELRTAPSHYAAFSSELPRRFILGWSPPGICVECGHGRVPVVDKRLDVRNRNVAPTRHANGSDPNSERPSDYYATTDYQGRTEATILGYACPCAPSTRHPGTGESSGPDGRYGNALDRGDGYPNTALGLGHAGLSARPKVGPWTEYHLDGWKAPPTRPAVVLDPFVGTGTTPMVARALGRFGVGLDLSSDYLRLARWRIWDSQAASKAISRTNLERQGSLL